MSGHLIEMNLSTDKSMAPPDTIARDVLIVDDQQPMRRLLATHIQAMGHHATVATNGREALELLAAQDFDLVLLDVLMPDMDGYTLLDTIKNDMKLRHIPVVMVSALDEVQSVVRCVQRGAEDYLSKPFDPTLLRARVGACLEKKRIWGELQTRYQQLQELETLRDSLTNMIVHDLRTPLTSFLTGLMTMQEVGALNAEQQELLGISLNGGQVLLGMINDLLDISKMESGSLVLERSVVDPAQLAEQAMSQVHFLAAARRSVLRSEVAPHLPRLEGDEAKLLRTLVNLLGNAIKFTPAQGIITLTIAAAENAQEPDGAMLFTVTDTGEGIPAEAFGRIFDKFGQVETRQSRHKFSTGLGLTFCKMVVESHGGRIWVESRLGQGSDFKFTLPLRSVPTT